MLEHAIIMKSSLHGWRIGSPPRHNASSICLGYVVFLDVYPTASVVSCDNLFLNFL